MSTEVQQIVVEIARFKLSRSIYQSKSSKVLAYVEGNYGNGKKFKTKENKLYGGAIFAIPHRDSISGMSIFVTVVDNDVTFDIGASMFGLNESQILELSSHPLELFVPLTRSGGRERVGKLLCKISKQNIFADGTDEVARKNMPTKKRAPNSIIEDMPVYNAVKGFRFNRLCRPIHWERLKALNVDRIQRSRDVTTLMTCLEDVATGDVSQEDVDPKLRSVLETAQYSVQYLLSCQKVMRSRESLLNDALRVFDEEEAQLDLRLAKLRTRDRALRREARSLDSLRIEYSELLEALDPELAANFRKTHIADGLSSIRQRAEDTVRASAEFTKVEERRRQQHPATDATAGKENQTSATGGGSRGEQPQPAEGDFYWQRRGNWGEYEPAPRQGKPAIVPADPATATVGSQVGAGLGNTGGNTGGSKPGRTSRDVWGEDADPPILDGQASGRSNRVADASALMDAGRSQDIRERTSPKNVKDAFGRDLANDVRDLDKPPLGATGGSIGNPNWMLASTATSVMSVDSLMAPDDEKQRQQRSGTRDERAERDDGELNTATGKGMGGFGWQTESDRRRQSATAAANQGTGGWISAQPSGSEKATIVPVSTSAAAAAAPTVPPLDWMNDAAEGSRAATPSDDDNGDGDSDIGYIPSSSSREPLRESPRANLRIGDGREGIATAATRGSERSEGTNRSQGSGSGWASARRSDQGSEHASARPSERTGPSTAGGGGGGAGDGNVSPRGSSRGEYSSQGNRSSLLEYSSDDDDDREKPAHRGEPTTTVLSRENSVRSVHSNDGGAWGEIDQRPRGTEMVAARSREPSGKGLSETTGGLGMQKGLSRIRSADRDIDSYDDTSHDVDEAKKKSATAPLPSRAAFNEWDPEVLSTKHLGVFGKNEILQEHEDLFERRGSSHNAAVVSRPSSSQSVRPAAAPAAAAAAALSQAADVSHSSSFSFNAVDAADSTTANMNVSLTNNPGNDLKDLDASVMASTDSISLLGKVGVADLHIDTQLTAHSDDSKSLEQSQSHSQSQFEIDTSQSIVFDPFASVDMSTKSKPLSGKSATSTATTGAGAAKGATDPLPKSNRASTPYYGFSRSNSRDTDAVAVPGAAAMSSATHSADPPPSSASAFAQHAESSTNADELQDFDDDPMERSSRSPSPFTSTRPAFQNRSAQLPAPATTTSTGVVGSSELGAKGDTLAFTMIQPGRRPDGSAGAVTAGGPSIAPQRSSSRGDDDDDDVVLMGTRKFISTSSQDDSYAVSFDTTNIAPEDISSIGNISVSAPPFPGGAAPPLNATEENQIAFKGTGSRLGSGKQKIEGIREVDESGAVSSGEDLKFTMMNVDMALKRGVSDGDQVNFGDNSATLADFSDMERDGEGVADMLKTAKESGKSSGKDAPTTVQSSTESLGFLASSQELSAAGGDGDGDGGEGRESASSSARAADNVVGKSGETAAGNKDDHLPETTFPEEEEEDPIGCFWTVGRAPLDLIETAEALDVLVSAVKLDLQPQGQFAIVIEFLGSSSQPSPSLPANIAVAMQPVTFSSHIRSDEGIDILLRDEIASEGEYLSVRLNIVELQNDGIAGETVAQGVVQLMVMIEDSCNIIRQEIDLVSMKDTAEIVGTAVVDVKGHYLLQRCAS